MKQRNCGRCVSVQAAVYGRLHLTTPDVERPLEKMEQLSDITGRKATMACGGLCGSNTEDAASWGNSSAQRAVPRSMQPMQRGFREYLLSGCTEGQFHFW